MDIISTYKNLVNALSLVFEEVGLIRRYSMIYDRKREKSKNVKIGAVRLMKKKIIIRERTKDRETKYQR